jgi:hypothetical protein
MRVRASRIAGASRIGPANRTEAARRIGGASRIGPANRTEAASRIGAASRTKSAYRIGAANRIVVMLVALCACGRGVVTPSSPQPLPPRTEVAIDTSPKARPRMVPPEAYLRAYLTWFGGLAPLEVQQKARGKQLFDAWDDYLAALGLPDYRLDLPRQAQTNTLMIATFGRLGEALCVRAAEHDLHDKKTPLDQRVVFAFDAVGDLRDDQFRERFDVLHRTFLGYPAALAPDDRVARYLGLYRRIAGHHTAKKPLTPEETAWAAVCAALVQHPETELY